MQRAEERTADHSATARSSRDPAQDPAQARVQGRVSVALLAAVACVPIVIAVGFLTDRRGDGTATAAAVPGDISVLALRGGLDASAARRLDLPVRAGY